MSALCHTLARLSLLLEATYSPNRNANGMLLFPPESVMIADDTNGPINADVLPICTGIRRSAITSQGKRRHSRQRRVQRTGTLGGPIVRIHDVVQNIGHTFAVEEKPRLSLFGCTHTTDRPLDRRTLDKAWNAPIKMCMIELNKKRTGANHISQTCLNPNLGV
jgi:hypothetical protein